MSSAECRYHPAEFPALDVSAHYINFTFNITETKTRIIAETTLLTHLARINKYISTCTS